MNTTDSMKKLILEHYATINYVPDFKTWKYHEMVWAWWEALAYYKIDHNYIKLEDAPEGLRWIAIMDDTRKNYEWVNGEYRYIQQMTKKECESIYGSRVPGS